MCAAMTSPRSPLERRSHWDTLRSLSLESVNLKNVADEKAVVDGRSTGREQMQPGECVNIAVIGCGGWAQGWHLPHILNRSHMIADMIILHRLHVMGLERKLNLSIYPMAPSCTAY